MEAVRAIENAWESVESGSGEAVLVAELQAGSDEAYDYVLSLYRNPVYRLVAHILGNDYDAADVLQNVFVKVVRGIPQFHGHSSLKTWIYRIAVREALNYRRGWFRRRVHEPFSIDEDSAEPMVAATENRGPSDPYETLEKAERQELLRTALNGLPVLYRTVLILREIEELSYEEIAQVLGIADGTVKSRLMRGRELLRRRLSSVLGY